jgi:protein-disulfide isomerase
MSKRAKRSIKKKQRKTNWGLIIGGSAGALLLFVGLLWLAFREPPATDLAAYCENNPGNCIIEGPTDAAMTIVEVSDYGCSHCGTFNRETAPLIIENYIDTEQIRWITVPYALSGQAGYPTLPSAVASMCANEQGKFREFHLQNYTQQGTPQFNTRDGFMEIATFANMDEDAFSSCLDNNFDTYQTTVLENIQAASSAGVSGTPTFFLNGSSISGAQPFAVFQQRIDAALGS